MIMGSSAHSKLWYFSSISMGCASGIVLSWMALLSAAVSVYIICGMIISIISWMDVYGGCCSWRTIDACKAW